MYLLQIDGELPTPPTDASLEAWQGWALLVIGAILIMYLKKLGFSFKKSSKVLLLFALLSLSGCVNQMAAKKNVSNWQHAQKLFNVYSEGMTEGEKAAHSVFYAEAERLAKELAE